MREPWQSLNAFLGSWAWVCVIASLAGSLLGLLFFAWARKVLPALRAMLAGEPRSYLRLSERGLVYRVWPLAEIRADWEVVEGLRHSAGWGDNLALRRAEVTGFLEFAPVAGKLHVHLSSLAGWPEGKLKADLGRYAPRLFQAE